MTGILLFGTFFIFVFLNVPIAVSLGLSSLIGLYSTGMTFAMFPNVMYSSVGKFALLAIPFFILAGTIMDYAGISKRLIRLARVCVGHTKSGMLAVVVIVSCFFAAISGSGPATVAALGSILIPALVDVGYRKDDATALMAASGGIGIVIPPSIAFVVYASVVEVSVGKLFAGGFIPGIILGLAFFFGAKFASRNNPNVKRLPKASGKERLDALKDSIWGLLMPVIILGGIYGGIFTPTEAAGVAVIYGLFVGIFIYREIPLKKLWSMFVESAVSSATVMYIVACASVFAWILTTSELAADLSSALLSLSSNKYVILALVNIIFLIAGCFLDANSAFYILVPIMAPVMNALGVDLIHFGVFITVNMVIGLITPPVGIDLYVGCRIANITVADLCKRIVPMLVSGIIALLIITYIPILTMFIPNLMG